MTTSPQRVDGRTARSERTRNAIVDAHLRLIHEGDLRPTAERIAKQAGVSLRALWSHFSDLEALFAARAPFYRMAAVRVQLTGSETVDETADRVLIALEDRLEISG